MKRDKRHRLLDYTRFSYNIKTIMMHVTKFDDLCFMCIVMYAESISIGEYLNLDFFNRNKPSTLRRVVTNSKSIRSVCISTNKKCIRDTSSSIHKLSDFK